MTRKVDDLDFAFTIAVSSLSNRMHPLAQSCASLQTQYTSHSYVSKQDAGKSLMSQIEGGKARSNRDFTAFLESQFTSEASAELVLA